MKAESIINYTVRYENTCKMLYFNHLYEYIHHKYIILYFTMDVWVATTAGEPCHSPSGY
jgi:hypothetical protein